MEMFSEKKVTILDSNFFKKGNFITYCYMEKQDYGARVEEGRPMNGIISHVGETYLSLYLSDGTKKTINLEQLQEPEQIGPKIKIKVLGVRDRA